MTISRPARGVTPERRRRLRGDELGVLGAEALDFGGEVGWVVRDRRCLLDGLSQRLR